MDKSLLYTVLFLFRSVSAGFAMDGCGAGSCSKCHSLTVSEANELLAGVGRVKKVDPAPVSGLWLLELEKDGKQGVVFMDFGKKNLIAGTVFPLPPKVQTGQPAAADRKQGKVDVAAIPLEGSIIMGNRNGGKRVFLFTDPECPFCSRMHGELKKLVAMDPEVGVYIKMLPLKMHPAAYDKARVIVGAKGNSLAMLEKAFAGLALPAPGRQDAKKPVDENISLASSLGIESTPTLVFSDGRVITGARDAAFLSKMLSAVN